MTEDFLQYDKLVEAALKGVVRSSLQIVQKHGLVGGHHFYITFRTHHAEVQVPKYIQEKYPDEMTIVLQYQFYNLEVEENKFSVSLSFNNIQEYLVVPFAAITGFADPSVKFGLQFHTHHASDDMGGEVLELPEVGKKPSKASTPKKSRSKTAKDKDGENDSGDNNVVSLDSFRKK